MNPNKLTDEQKAKLESCKDPAELKSMLSSMGVELTDEQLEELQAATTGMNALFILCKPQYSKEKQQFMYECSKMEIYSSVILRRFIHLFLTDRTVRTAVLNFNDPNHFYAEDF